jgi:hypothetical protein
VWDKQEYRDEMGEFEDDLKDRDYLARDDYDEIKKEQSAY